VKVKEEEQGGKLTRLSVVTPIHADKSRVSTYLSDLEHEQRGNQYGNKEGSETSRTLEEPVDLLQQRPPDSIIPVILVS